MLSVIPQELVQTISQSLNVCDILSLKTTCSEFKQLLSIDKFVSKQPFTFTVKNDPNKHQFFCYSTDEILSVLWKELNAKPPGHIGVVKNFYSARHEAYITFIINPDDTCLFHIMPTFDDFQTAIRFQMFEVTSSDGKLKANVHGCISEIPAMLFFLGMKFMLRHTDIKLRSFDDIKKDFDFDLSEVDFIEKAIVNNNYSGLMFSDLLSSSVFITTREDS